MAEYIEREALLNSKQWRSLKSEFDQTRAKCIIATFPAADVVEVVRCKECKYWECGKDYEPYCNHWGNMMSETNADDFCSYGERKNND